MERGCQVKPKKVAIAADHRGVALKKELITELTKNGYDVQDLGPNSEESCDYPDYAAKVGLAVQQGKSDRGIVMCHSGIGMSIAANKIKGVRASLCQTVEAAELARKHNDANVLAMGSGYVTPELAKKIALAWLKTDFEGGRHERRVQKISEYENQN